MMGHAFAGLFIFYVMISMVFMPLVIADGYLAARDCRVKYEVDACKVLHVPAVQP